MFKIVEDTITQYFVEYFRTKGFNVDLKRSISLPDGKRGEPDLVITNYGIFYGEAEWEDTSLKGFAQAHDYSNALSTKWKEYLQKRMSNLGIIETLHVDASGTYFFAYYTEKPRVFGSSFWNVVGVDSTEAKILAIWLNSTINLAQLFIERVPTGWFKVRGYTFNNLSLLSKSKLSPNDLEAITDLFDSVSKIRFPCLWKQLAMNVDQQTLTDEWKKMLAEIFPHFKKYLGSSFRTRREIDEVILKILGYKRKEINDILEWLYPALLREIYILKKLNRVDTSSS